MASNRREWEKFLGDKLMWFWVAVFVLASFMLWRKWKSGSPWPMGAFMPF